MTTEEMNRRIEEMSPKAAARVEWFARNTTYSEQEVFAFWIPGASRLACVNAVFEKVRRDT